MTDVYGLLLNYERLELSTHLNVIVLSSLANVALGKDRFYHFNRGAVDIIVYITTMPKTITNLNLVQIRKKFNVIFAVCLDI